MSADAPLLSLVLAPGSAAPEAVQDTLDSLLAQRDDGWELLLQGDVPSELPRSDDPRVRRGSGWADACGEFVAQVDAGGRLAADAVASLRAAAEATPDLDLAWCHETTTDYDGSRRAVRKPAIWAPERLRGQRWTGRLTFLRRELVAAVAREGFVGEHDLVLRVGERARERQLLPALLYDRPETAAAIAESDWTSGVTAVEAHLVRSGASGTVSRGPAPGTHRITRSVPSELSVAVVVPTDGMRGLAWGEQRRYVTAAVRSLLAHAGHRVEVVVVYTPGTPRRTLEELAVLAGDDLRLVPFGADYSWAAMVNRGALATGADVLVLLDQRAEVTSPELVPRLVGALLDGDVGLTAPRVSTSDGRLVDAGLAWFQHRVHPMLQGALESDPGPGGILLVDHECSALSGTCLALTRETFDVVGGVNEVAHGFAAADLSFKVAHQGLSRLWVAGARLYRHGLDREDTRRLLGVQLMKRRWASPEVDPYVPDYGSRQAERAAAELRELLSTPS
jgi:GT2 family glycosyltransferase